MNREDAKKEQAAARKSCDTEDPVDYYVYGPVAIRKQRIKESFSLQLRRNYDMIICAANGLSYEEG